MATQNGQPPKTFQCSLGGGASIPQFELTIGISLMDRNESFREMCEELAEAELALVKGRSGRAGIAREPGELSGRNWWTG